MSARAKYARIEGDIGAALGRFAGAVKAEVLRPAAHAGAVVLQDEIKARAPVHEGTLKSAVYRAHAPEQSGDSRQVYAVGVNMKKAPHWHLVEFGHWRVNVIVRLPNGQTIATKERLDRPVWVPAVPYLRPAWDAKGAAAVQAMIKRARERMSELNATGETT